MRATTPSTRGTATAPKRPRSLVQWGVSARQDLSYYGVQPSAVFRDTLVVPPETVVRLTFNENLPGSVFLRPKDIDDVKRWIGIPDEAAANLPQVFKCPCEVTLANTQADLRKMSPCQMRAIWSVAAAYVRGNSQALTQVRPTLNLLIDGLLIGSLFLQDMDIYGTLEIDPSVLFLHTRAVRVWNRGSINVLGDLSIVSASMQVKTRIVPPFVLTSVPKIGQVIKPEVING